MTPRALLLAGALLLLTGAAQSGGYALPEESLPTLPAGPDAELVAGACSACHSLDYVLTQPRGKGAQFWKDSVAKMISVYGAPLEPEEADRISAYLAEHYGKTGS